MLDDGEVDARSDPDRAQPDSVPSMGAMHDSPAGRFVLSVLLGLLVLTLVVWNLPRSEIRDELRPLIRPYVNALAIDQRWALFSPNPSTISIEVRADVEFADGTTTTFHFPDGGPVVGALREYRWRKFERRIRLDDNDHLWEPTAQWIAAQYQEPISSITLVRRFSRTPEPGSGETRVWSEFEFYSFTPASADDAS